MDPEMGLGRKVTITSANSLVGRGLLGLLAGTPAETFALIRRPVELPADHLISGWMTSGAAAGAITDAGVVVHLSGEISARSEAEYDAANVETTRRVADHLRAGQRVVFISYPGADPNSDNPFLRAKGKAEALLRESPAATFIFRTQIIAHHPSQPGPFEEAVRQPKSGGKVRVIGDGRSKVKPIYQDDVLATAVSVASGRGRPGTYDLVGVEELTMDDIVRHVNGRQDISISHVPGWIARILGRFVPDLSPAFVDLFLRRPQPGDPTRAIEEFDLGLMSVTSVWRRA